LSTPSLLSSIYATPFRHGIWPTNNINLPFISFNGGQVFAASPHVLKGGSAISQGARVSEMIQTVTAKGYGKGEMKFASKKKRGAKESTGGTRKKPRRRGLKGLRKEVVEKGSTEETTVPNRKSADAEQVTGGTHATPKKRRILPWLREEGVEKAEKAEARRREMEKGRLGGVNEEEEEEEGEDKDEKEYDEADE
jgi:hypothetical protein